MTIRTNKCTQFY